jgi:hypothetical protein
MWRCFFIAGFTFNRKNWLFLFKNNKINFALVGIADQFLGAGAFFATR